MCVEGIEHVPSTGAAVLAANHGGAAIPYDAAMLQLALFNEPAVPRRVRVVGTEVFNMLPFVSHLYRKIGAAYASRQDARWVLGNGQLLGCSQKGCEAFRSRYPSPTGCADRPGRVRIARRRSGGPGGPGGDPRFRGDAPGPVHVTHPGGAVRTVFPTNGWKRWRCGSTRYRFRCGG